MPSSEYKCIVGNISEMTRWRHEKAGIGPTPVRRGGRNFYFQDEVEAYLDQLAASRQRIPDEKSADVAEGENLCLAERTAAQ
jgi:hypothetical protein